MLDESEHIVHMRAHGDCMYYLNSYIPPLIECVQVLLSLSGPGETNLRAYDVKSGGLLWQSPLPDSFLGRVSEPANTGSDFAFTLDGEDDVIVLSNSQTVRRLDKGTGGVKWEWVAADHT